MLRRVRSAWHTKADKNVAGTQETLFVSSAAWSMERNLRMKTEFEHDATPTWSGFIYQGYVAVYLAVRKICDLRERPDAMEIQEIAAYFKMELENWEDVAVFREDEQGKQYISIHQVKNRRETHIGDYKEPLVQLLLEKSKLRELGLGAPEAYLHVSSKIREDSVQIQESLQNWRDKTQDFYNRLQSFRGQETGEDAKREFQQKILALIKAEPIGLNRTKYRNLLKEIESSIKKEQEISILKNNIENLWNYLKNELAVGDMEAEAEIYVYDDGADNCPSENFFGKIVGQVRRYKEMQNGQEHLTDEQYEYIADKLLDFMRNFVSERHRSMQENRDYAKDFSFSEVIRILDECVRHAERNANIMALRRKYDEAISQYCRMICRNKCKDEGAECRLLHPEYAITDFDEDSFIRMCFSYNPDCDKGIEDRGCLGKLLNKDGLQNSVFKVLRECSKEYLRREKDRTRVVINDENKNAFLTAITCGNVDIAVEDIVNGINNNTAMVSSAFEADELITERLSSTDEEMWDSSFCNIQEKYLSERAKENSDNIQDSICVPKKPAFVTAEEVMKRLLL